MENASLLVQVSSFTYTTFTLQKKNGILKRTTSDIFNVEKKTVHVLNNYVHDISVLLGC